MISHVPPLASIFAFADALNALALTASFFVSSPSPRILTPSARAIGQTDRAQRDFIHLCAVIEFVQIADVDGDVCGW